MSTHAVPTVRVVAPVSAENPHGFVVINAADFDAAQHEEFGATVEQPAPKRKSKAAE